jgi:hypothetical protein
VELRPCCGDCHLLATDRPSKVTGPDPEGKGSIVRTFIWDVPWWVLSEAISVLNVEYTSKAFSVGSYMEDEMRRIWK